MFRIRAVGIKGSTYQIVTSIGFPLNLFNEIRRHDGANKSESGGVCGGGRIFFFLLIIQA